ncbi:long tail fiber proximal subunit [Acinetobacter phage AB1I1M-1]
MSEIKTSFRSSYGLDAAGEKVVNVAKADKTVMTDGVNVEYLIQENTVQPYDPNRGYEKLFVVQFNDRLWIAKDNIPSPAGPFSEGYWRAVRTDPKWKPVNNGQYQLQVGDYITVDTTQGLPVELTLPRDAQDGDNITIKEVGGDPGYVDVVIKANVQSIYDKGQKLAQAKITVPYSEWTFVYVNKMWNLYNGSEEPVARTIKTSGPNRIQSGETIIRSYDQLKPIVVIFPKNANNGDIIHFMGMDETATPYFHLELHSFDNNTNVIAPGIKVKVLQRSLSGYFVYEESTATWLLYDTDMTNRLRTVGSDTNLFPNETVAVVGTNNTTVQTINLTLPQNVEPGDQITVALNHIRLNQTVNIVASGTDKILTDKNLVQFPKRSSYPPSGNWVNSQSLSFNGSTDYPPVIKFAYIDMGPIKQWLVVSNVPALERVDPTSDATRGRLGVIALATQTQANLDKESISATVNPMSREVAITPETLANRTAIETRRGIARIATQAEVNLTTGNAALADDLIVTPKKLDAKQATEVMRGVAEIATQAETNTNTNDTHIVTPKKLDGRRATPTMAGVAPVVTSGGVPPVDNGTNTRDTAGTLIYNHADYSNIVTPKTLREYISTPIAMGAVFLAKEAEVIAGTPADAKHPTVVTPETLHAKTATKDRIGLVQNATQTEVDAGVDDTKFVTPKTLNDRKATETLSGVARQATIAEFRAGTANLISGPDKIKTYLSEVRTAVGSGSGLVQSGNLWGTLSFDILNASTTQRGTTSLATQAEVDAGEDNTKIVTPLTLQNKVATESVRGLAQYATIDETASGLINTKAVVPVHLKNLFQVHTDYSGTTTRRGTLKTSSGSITWVGNDTQGNTQPLTSYQDSDYAVSPRELNRVLANYLPLKAKAVDSDTLDGLDSTQFIRRDIDQTVNGAITFTQTTTAAAINASGAVKSSSSISGATGIGVDSTAADGRGVSLYGGASAGAPEYGILFASTTTTTLGKHGYVTGNFATYLTMNNGSDRGWIFRGSNTNVASISALGSAYFDGAVASGTAFRLKTGSALWLDGNNAINLGNTSQNLILTTIDASNIRVSDQSGSYQAITTKNLVTEADKTYIRKSGDTVVGRINFTAPTTTTIPQTSVAPNSVPNSNNFGTWTVSITDENIYNTMRPYLVAVPDYNAETGQPTGFIKEYKEFNGPGTLSQFGSNAANADGTYQIWAPRPPDKYKDTDGHIAGTYWMRHWNTAKNRWDGWGRVYTSNNPPTSSEIGAMANNGSVFDSLRIRDWIQVGNLRIYADPATKTVRFDWIE